MKKAHEHLCLLCCQHITLPKLSAFLAIKKKSASSLPCTSTSFSARLRGRPHQGKRQVAVAPSLPPAPTREAAPTQISATKADSRPCLFRGLCLWWFLLDIISLYISRQLAESHLILTGLENLIGGTRKASEKVRR